LKRREKEGGPAGRCAGLPDRDTGACGDEFPEPGAKENGLLGDSPGCATGLRETETLFMAAPPRSPRKLGDTTWPVAPGGYTPTACMTGSGAR